MAGKEEEEEGVIFGGLIDPFVCDTAFGDRHSVQEIETAANLR